MTFSIQGSIKDPSLLEKWIAKLLFTDIENKNGKKMDFLRIKGVVAFADSKQRHIVQAVQQVFGKSHNYKYDHNHNYNQKCKCKF